MQRIIQILRILLIFQIFLSINNIYLVSKLEAASISENKDLILWEHQSIEKYDELPYMGDAEKYKKFILKIRPQLEKYIYELKKLPTKNMEFTFVNLQGRNEVFISSDVRSNMSRESDVLGKMWTSFRDENINVCSIRYHNLAPQYAKKRMYLLPRWNRMYLIPQSNICFWYYTTLKENGRRPEGNYYIEFEFDPIREGVEYSEIDLPEIYKIGPTIEARFYHSDEHYGVFIRQREKIADHWYYFSDTYSQDGKFY